MKQIGFYVARRATRCLAISYLFLYAGLLSAVNCLAQESTQADEAVKPGTPAQSSRLRMFGQNGASAVLYRGQACVKDFWSDDGEKASGGLDSAFSSFIGRVSNASLGIPETKTSRNLSNRDEALSKAYFREYFIPADQPSSIRLGFQDISSFYVPVAQIGRPAFRYAYVDRGCHGAISFVPGAAKDYEVAFSWQGKTCRAAINEVVRKGDTVELIPVPVSVAPDC